MTALAAFFAMAPGALALERGSEANAPLARAILGGLMAVEPSTLLVLPCLYSLLVRDQKRTHPHGGHSEGDASALKGDVAENDAEGPDGFDDLGRDHPSEGGPSHFD
jgi:hypothetical protein